MGIFERLRDPMEWTHNATIRKSLIAVIGGCAIWGAARTAPSTQEYYDRLFTSSSWLSHVVQPGDNLTLYARCEDLSNGVRRDYYDFYLRTYFKNARYFLNGKVKSPLVGPGGKVFVGTTIYLPDVFPDSSVGFDSTKAACR